MFISYLASRALLKPLVFLKRWYKDFSRKFWATAMDLGAALDRVLAIKIMFQTICQPLYGDYSTVGRIIGPMFRAARILIALPIFAAYFITASALWLAWLAIPPYLILRAIGLV